VTDEMAEIGGLEHVEAKREDADYAKCQHQNTVTMRRYTKCRFFCCFSLLLLVAWTLRSADQLPKCLLMPTQPTRFLRKAELATWVGLQASCSGPAGAARGPRSRR
jgi:hypothetical protein